VSSRRLHEASLRSRRLAFRNVIFCDGAHEVLLVHQQTGAVRDAPWIALCTRDRCIYFANLLTRETRWLPPHLWLHGWVSRIEISDTLSRGLFRSNMSQALDSAGRDLPCDGRKPLPSSDAFQRVEGGAPYMCMSQRTAYRSTHLPTRRGGGLAAHVPARGQLCTLAASLVRASYTRGPQLNASLRIAKGRFLTRSYSCNTCNFVSEATA